MTTKVIRKVSYIGAGLALAGLALAFDAKHNPIIPNLPATPAIISTVPPNGDINPYGVAFAPATFPKGGTLNGGDILVSNFNAASNLQGTGTTVVRIPPGGTSSSLFFRGKSLGLTTALGITKFGFALVGNMPTTDGTCATVKPGSILILDRNGNLVSTLRTTYINGPWDLTVYDRATDTDVFVSNVLTGTVDRLNFAPSSDGSSLILQNHLQIASGYTHRCDVNALEIGPTGLAFDPVKHILYVASTGDNAIYAIPNADTRTTDGGIGSVVYTDQTHLHGPLGLVLTPNGDLITTNGDAINPDPAQPSEIVEFTTAGVFVAQRSVDPASGAAFGIALAASASTVRFAAVDDATNTLDLWTLH